MFQRNPNRRFFIWRCTEDRERYHRRWRPLKSAEMGSYKLSAISFLHISSSWSSCKQFYCHVKSSASHRKNAFAASSQRWIENTCMVHDVESRWLLPYSALLSYWTRIIRYRFDLSVMILEEGSYVVLVRVWGRRKGRMNELCLAVVGRMNELCLAVVFSARSPLPKERFTAMCIYKQCNAFSIVFGQCSGCRAFFSTSFIREHSSRAFTIRFFMYCNFRIQI